MYKGIYLRSWYRLLIAKCLAEIHNLLFEYLILQYNSLSVMRNIVLFTTFRGFIYFLTLFAVYICLHAIFSLYFLHCSPFLANSFFFFILLSKTWTLFLHLCNPPFLLIIYICWGLKCGCLNRVENHAVCNKHASKSLLILRARVLL